jgi:2-polyprenyl-6-methoxyphenol hydroxylase-like FAD-dependent oxidoreductase
VLPAALRYRDIWIVRLGRLAEVKPIEEYGVAYSALVNRLRGLVPGNVAFRQHKVTDVALSAERQVLTLAGGEQVSARLVIGAGGATTSLAGTRRAISRCHSVSIGFDLEAADWPFAALTCFGADPVHRVAYLTLFPLPTGMRANLFVYRTLDDPWLRRLREAPAAAIAECLPGLAQFTGALRVRGAVKIRPVDLVATDDAVQPGVALVGDAHATSCPVSGTGAAKALVDVERLCNVHVPNWLATGGMGAEKIAQYYADPEKRRSDAHALRTSLFARRIALGEGLLWSALRWGTYAGALGRHLLGHRALAALPPGGAVAASVGAKA